MTSTDDADAVHAGDVDHSQLPPLMRDSSFWGANVTQFLGAFNDNVFKQLMLLLATPTAAAIAAGEEARDLQGEAMVIFASAFLLFSGTAGYVADKLSKRTVIVASKVGEICVMLLGLAGFYYYDVIGFSGMLCVLFLMGLQSAFFGPAKYGILPEMLRDGDLPRANGVFLMFTFLAIIFGTAVAGLLLEALGSKVWLASIVCVAIAVVGTLSSTLIRRVPVAAPDMRFDWKMAGVSGEMVSLLRKDRALLGALIVCSMFWMIGGIVQQGVNALGKTQLGLGEGPTSIMAASIGLGLAIGCVLGGFLSKGTISSGVVRTGSIGICTTLIVMALPGGENRHLLGYPGSVPVLVLLGIFTGIFIVPIQVALQSLPPREEKGRMIALMNQCTWVGIILGALVYKACVVTLDATGGPRSVIFLVTSLIMLPVALFYRPTGDSVRTTSDANAQD
ncbi:MAG: MFS transporter [Planctomycetota bacterium]